MGGTKRKSTGLPSGKGPTGSTRAGLPTGTLPTQTLRLTAGTPAARSRDRPCSPRSSVPTAHSFGAFLPNPRHSAPEPFPQGRAEASRPARPQSGFPRAEPPTGRTLIPDGPRSRSPPTYRPARGLPAQSPGTSPACPAPRRQRGSARPALPQEAPPLFLSIGQRGSLSYRAPALIGPARRPSKRGRPPPCRRLVEVRPSARLPLFSSSPIRSERRQSLRLRPPTKEPHALTGARSVVAARARAGSSSSFPSPLPPPSAVASRAAAPRSLALPSLSVVCGARSGKVGARGGSGRQLHLRARGGVGGGSQLVWQGGGARQPRPLRSEPRGGARPSASAARRPPARGGRGLGAGRERRGAARGPRATAASGPSPPGAARGRCRVPGLSVFPALTNAGFQHPHPRARLAPRALHTLPFALPRPVSPLPAPTRGVPAASRRSKPRAAPLPAHRRAERCWKRPRGAGAVPARLRCPKRPAPFAALPHVACHPASSAAALPLVLPVS